MSQANIMNSDDFSLTSLTASINALPFVPGQVGASGIFDGEGITTISVQIESQNGSLSIIADKPRGAPGSTMGGDNRKMVTVTVPHFPISLEVLADEVQNVRAFGTDSDLETVQNRVDVKLAKGARSLDATTELLRVGAIKGVVMGKDNQLLDLFQTFGVTAAAPIVWDLANAGFKTRGAASSLKDSIENDLEATSYSGLHAFCGSAFFAALVDHPTIRETYLGYQAAADLRGEVADKFTFGGITFERYRMGGKAKAANKGVEFIAPNKARVVVKGVPDLFIERYAPAPYNETVNTIGLPRYARAFEKRNATGYDLEMQMNIIPICTQPATLRELTLA